MRYFAESFRKSKFHLAEYENICLDFLTMSRNELHDYTAQSAHLLLYSEITNAKWLKFVNRNGNTVHLRNYVCDY